ncbi:MAG TPA: sigma-70 family RNA polymerase sigma factor [Armatimonadota bacterium]|jgi:RNA polymerase sigma-70 factor (ECF subfamily)
MTDEVIIRKVQAGDLALFGELHKRYYKRVWGYLHRCIRDEETSKDLAADTFVNAYRAIGHYEVREQGRFGPFLLKIARNLLIDHQRSRKPWTFSALESEEGQTMELPSGEPSLLDRILEEERVDRVKAALDQLSDADREILALAYQQELSLKEIALVTGKPSVSAVTSHLHRAISKLRGLIRADEYFTEDVRPNVDQ